MGKIILLLLAIAGICTAFPSGPPDNACQTRLPQHTPHSPQTGDCPYAVYADRWAPGETVRLAMFHNDNDGRFKGFLISITHNGVPVGRMNKNLVDSKPKNTPVKTRCDGTSLSHADGTRKEFIYGNWTAPEDLPDSAKLKVRLTVVEEYKEFWVDCNSWDLVHVDDVTTTTSTTTTTSATTSSTSTTSTTEEPTTTEKQTTTKKSTTTKEATTTEEPTTTTEKPTTTTKEPTTTTKEPTTTTEVPTTTEEAATTEEPTTTTEKPTTTVKRTTTTEKPTTTTEEPTTTTKEPTTTTEVPTTTEEATTTEEPTTTVKRTTTTEKPTTTTKEPTTTTEEPTTTTEEATTKIREQKTTQKMVKRTGKPAQKPDAAELVEGSEPDKTVYTGQDYLKHDVITTGECKENGNYYHIVAGSNCKKFVQRDANGKEALHECGYWTAFDPYVCACAHIKECQFK